MENNYKKRTIREMIHILHDKNTCNYKKDTENIGNNYFNLIQMIKPRKQNQSETTRIDTRTDQETRETE